MPDLEIHTRRYEWSVANVLSTMTFPDDEQHRREMTAYLCARMSVDQGKRSGATHIVIGLNDLESLISEQFIRNAFPKFEQIFNDANIATEILCIGIAKHEYGIGNISINKAKHCAGLFHELSTRSVDTKWQSFRSVAHIWLAARYIIGTDSIEDIISLLLYNKEKKLFLKLLSLGEFIRKIAINISHSVNGCTFSNSEAWKIPDSFRMPRGEFTWDRSSLSDAIKSILKKEKSCKAM